ncbi:MAG: enolase C-terminal domain-like protein [Armatimonadota bacterium]|nr:hypothetical protein [Armatimonadota bacterium]MCX7777826.1 hypothetical protein [Armatimonadota bacterium]MDW8025941.1 enolase C-terminal domain-like protein [Armatimonadota bacterium]
MDDSPPTVAQPILYTNIGYGQLSYDLGYARFAWLQIAHYTRASIVTERWSNMHIEAIFIAIACLPFKRRYATAKVVRQPNSDYSTHVFVKLQSSDGTIGWGEVPTDDLQAIHVCNLLTKRFVPSILEKSEFESQEALAQLAASGEWGDPSFRLAFASLETAYVDLIAKRLNVPASMLLTGKCVGQTPVAFTVSLMSPEWIYDQLSELERPRWLKVNLAGNLEEDLERVEEVARLHPQAQLWLDADGGFKSFSEATCFLEQVGGVGNVALCSSPINGGSLLALQRLRNKSPLPIAVDSECITPQDVTLLAHLCAADMVIVDIPKLGGITAAQTVAQVAIAHGFELVVRTRMSTQVGIAAALHTFCGLNFRVGIEADGLQFISAPTASGLQLQEGNLTVSKRPGFGIEVDEAALRELSAQTFEVP